MQVDVAVVVVVVVLPDTVHLAGGEGRVEYEINPETTERSDPPATSTKRTFAIC